MGGCLAVGVSYLPSLEIGWKAIARGESGESNR
jgi:hypothetical protein